MPPEENTNNNGANLNTFRVGIDPVFKSNNSTQNKTVDQNNPSSISSNSGGAYSVLGNQKYTPAEPSTPAYSIPNKSPSSAPKSIIRTYKGDIESAVQTSHLSSVNIAIAENQRMQKQIIAKQEEAAPTNNYSKNKIIIFICLILIIGAIIGVSILYFLNNKGTGQIVQVKEFPALITTEFKAELDINSIFKDKFILTLSAKLNDSQITVNNFYNIYLTTGTSSERKLISTTDFISLMQFKMPSIIKRTLLPDFMVGMYAFGKNLPFVILKSSYFENAYAGMLQWEPDMEKDFQILFRLSGYENNQDALADLTPTVYKKFEDGVIINKDVRILRDENGEIMLLYGIIDKETIIITVNDTAFKEIINRLNKEKGLKR